VSDVIEVQQDAEIQYKKRMPNIGLCKPNSHLDDSPASWTLPPFVRLLQRTVNTYIRLSVPLRAHAGHINLRPVSVR
jgi:hypothetical protein